MNQLERNAIKTLNIKSYELIHRAGQACYELARVKWIQAQYWVILCGYGNNGGKGYVIAKLAQAAGIKVTVIACLDKNEILTKENQEARNAWLLSGGIIYNTDISWPKKVDLIVDALFGTDLNSAPVVPYNQLIEKINYHIAPVLAVDMPSGLMAINGTVPGVAVSAQCTLSIIGLKIGQLIGRARDYVGHLYCHNLGLNSFFSDIKTPIIRYDANNLKYWLKTPKSTQYKGDNGRLLVIGGDIGMGGAIRITAEAALRSGVGIVQVLTHKNNVGAIVAARPELMVNALNKEVLQKALEWADVIAIGPGLGKRNWGKDALNIVQSIKKPMVWDADALNLLAINQNYNINRIITPHLGEASRLLGIKIIEIEHDPLSALQSLLKQYGGIVVLKGAGTLIGSITGEIAVADVGNEGMASAGMGDALTGIIASLVAQHFTLLESAYAGCIIHGAAADEVACLRGKRGMLATDIIKLIWKVINPEVFKY
ncbi:NAD(P)H-hydrate dehydratase [Pantoea sp. Mhis]|nr:NAD(P)H-hydrate dehydratase [Pantoea sp. Mhis]